MLDEALVFTLDAVDAMLKARRWEEPEMAPIDPRVTCHHQVFYLPGGDQSRSQDSGRSATYAVQRQRARIVETAQWERGDDMAEQEVIRDVQRAKGEYQKRLGRAETRIAELERENAALSAASARAVSDLSALAGELELAAWPAPDVNQWASSLGQRLRGIAATLDGAGWGETSVQQRADQVRRVAALQHLDAALHELEQIEGWAEHRATICGHLERTLKKAHELKQKMRASR
jgi:hypothetical protein